MKILLQNKKTLNYVRGVRGWTALHEQAREFRTGLEALFFCFNQHTADMQILGEFADRRMNFSFPVMDAKDG